MKPCGQSMDLSPGPQTRLMLPAWLGAGQALHESHAGRGARISLRDMMRQGVLFWRASRCLKMVWPRPNGASPSFYGSAWQIPHSGHWACLEGVRCSKAMDVILAFASELKSFTSLTLALGESVAFAIPIPIRCILLASRAAGPDPRARVSRSILIWNAPACCWTSGRQLQAGMRIR